MNPKKHSILCAALGVLVLSPCGFPQARLSAQKDLVGIQSSEVASAKQQSTELDEAFELSSRVLKLYAEGKFKEALPFAIRALEIREKALSADDQLVLNAQINLAEVYMALGKYSSAEPPLQRAVKSMRSANPNDIRLADLLERAARVYSALGNAGKVEAAYEESLRVKEQVFGSENPKIAEPLLMLAEFHQLEGNDKKAATFYKRLVAVREKDANSEEVVDAIARYVCVLGKLGEKEEADRWRARLASLQNRNSPDGSKPDAGPSKEAFVRGGVLNGKAISLPRPEYPDEAKNARASGTVVVEVVVDETGRVMRACAVFGPEKLRRASERAAYQSRFSPLKVEGKPVKVSGVLTYNYVIQ